MKKLLLAGAGIVLATGIVQAAPGDRAGRLDTNGDGSVTAAEMQERLAGRFQRLDTDKDGSLTQAEMQVAHKARAEKRADRIEKRGERQGHRLARLDTDKNGAVSLAEFTAHAQQRAARHGGDAAQLQQ